MPEISSEFFDHLKAYVGFDQADADQLRAAGDAIEPIIPEVVGLFYRNLKRDKQAVAIVHNAGSSLDRLANTLCGWVLELFSGTYDWDYCQRHVSIGRVHVRHHLPQYYMCTGMSVIRNALNDHIRQADIADPDRTMAALNKLLDLELALMLQTYKEEADQRIRASEREAMEKRLAESEHLANVGQLAATLAHEIKNPLAGISGAIQVIGASLAPDNPHKEIIGEVLAEIDRLDETVRDLLVYARPKPPRRKRVYLGKLLQDAIIQLRTHPAVQGLVIHCKGLSSAVEAFVDEALFRQVITNLFLNAAHACESGGEVSCCLSSGDGFVRIEVVDTGIGLAASDASRVFEPFFTTKAKGTGLGLPICRRIVESHGGNMELRSEEGHGTSVSIEMPVEL